MRNERPYIKNPPGTRSRTPSKRQRTQMRKAYLREMTSQGLVSTPDGGWQSQAKLGMTERKVWKNNYCGTFPHAILPAFGLYPKGRKK